MKLIVRMIREIAKMLNHYVVDNPTLPVNQCFSHFIQILAECQAVLWECRAATMYRQVFGTHMFFQETFCKSSRVFFSTFSAGIESLGLSNVSEHTSPHVMSESQTPAQDQRRQSGPSVRNSFVPSEGKFSKNYGTDQQRLQISDPHFDKFHQIQD